MLLADVLTTYRALLNAGRAEHTIADIAFVAHLVAA